MALGEADSRSISRRSSSRSNGSSHYHSSMGGQHFQLLSPQRQQVQQVQPLQQQQGQRPHLLPQQQGQALLPPPQQQQQQPSLLLPRGGGAGSWGLPVQLPRQPGAAGGTSKHLHLDARVPATAREAALFSAMAASDAAGKGRKVRNIVISGPPSLHYWGYGCQGGWARGWGKWAQVDCAPAEIRPFFFQNHDY